MWLCTVMNFLAEASVQLKCEMGFNRHRHHPWHHHFHLALAAHPLLFNWLATHTHRETRSCSATFVDKPATLPMGLIRARRSYPDPGAVGIHSTPPLLHRPSSGSVKMR